MWHCKVWRSCKYGVYIYSRTLVPDTTQIHISYNYINTIRSIPIKWNQESQLACIYTIYDCQLFHHKSVVHPFLDLHVLTETESLSLSQFYFCLVVLLFFFIAFIFFLPLFVRTFCSFVRSATSYQCITILRCIAIRFITWHINLLLPLPVHSLIWLLVHLLTCSFLPLPHWLIHLLAGLLISSFLFLFSEKFSATHAACVQGQKLLPAMGNTAKASECLAGYSPASTAYAGLFCQNLGNRADSCSNV